MNLDGGTSDVVLHCHPGGNSAAPVVTPHISTAECRLATSTTERIGEDRLEPAWL